MRTWTLTDNLTNTTTCMQTITVVDDVPPVLSPCPANFHVNADGSCSATVTYADPTAYDVGSFEGFENSQWVSGNYVNSPSTDWNDSNSHMTRVSSGTPSA